MSSCILSIIILYAEFISVPKMMANLMKLSTLLGVNGKVIFKN
ncbi:hypothetical protein JCM19301_3633 [Jejuia pallidilutea]|uniref:Uncharacterized protein n=1 Tax=Jejuia pallidilutea TaxID=504487 RepID=A0A090W161_9FLAO|nr:hypothetical protein JCM19301_3633 [Jejuia pallidilutea]GAL69219.1 hypothetical protein JCM19302_3948 [Jejuia pallidilutea]GAL89225.1 hypothetical protein JCM19538_2888 [Jejuia pallidilutea]